MNPFQGVGTHTGAVGLLCGLPDVRWCSQVVRALSASGVGSGVMSGDVAQRWIFQQPQTSQGHTLGLALNLRR